MKYASAFDRVADRLRARGFTVIEADGWTTRSRRKDSDFASIETITIHHTATGGAADYASQSLVTNGRPDLDGPLCNWGVGRFGGIYLISAGPANHTGLTWKLRESNAYAIGIECENNGVGEVWRPEMRAAMVALVQELRAEFDVARDDVLGHREICSPNGRKIDPANFDMNAFRAATDTWEDEEMDQGSLNTLLNAAGIIERALGTEFASNVEHSTWKGFLPQAMMNTNADAFMLRRELAEVRALVASQASVIAILAQSKGADAEAIRAAAEEGAREALDGFTLKIEKETLA